VDLMAVAVALDEVRDAVRDAAVVLPVGARTHWEVANPPVPTVPEREATEVRAPDGIVDYEPADLTVTVGAGTSVGALAVALAEHGQECILDPRSTDATVGGLLATGLSGTRRLRHGPLRDRVLEVQFVNAAGDVVKGGGRTVKNVSGFDIPRLLVGSFGTIGVIVQVTLRCQPVAEVSRWAFTTGDPTAVRSTAYAPSSVLWDGRATHVLFEGVAVDLDAELRASGAVGIEAGPELPEGAHRGRISVRPSSLRALAPMLDQAGVRWLAEIGVGTVHVGADAEADLAAARAASHAHGGWMLRESGAPTLDGFGVELPNAALQARIRDAFDPDRKLSPGRLPT
jgi:glycolate oxidase FAD binding subunit